MKDNLTWHETIKYIRTLPEFNELVEKAYFDENLVLNVERFKRGEEYRETLSILRQYAPKGIKVLDIGSGNGISAVSFATDGYQVTVAEPDPSDTVGAEAIRKLKAHYHLESMEIYQAFAEQISFKDEEFDIVYFRQAMHHAADLKKFLKESVRVLKRGGLLLTVRDHVVFDEKDKELFLQTHPLQKFYGGENAFSSDEYKEAMTLAGLSIRKELKFLDSVINYFPIQKKDVKKFSRTVMLGSKFGFLWRLGPLIDLYVWFKTKKKISVAVEPKFIGRMYSYICIKN